MDELLVVVQTFSSQEKLILFKLGSWEKTYSLTGAFGADAMATLMVFSNASGYSDTYDHLE